VGYYDLHKHANINHKLNRLISNAGDLAEIIALLENLLEKRTLDMFNKIMKKE